MKRPYRVEGYAIVSAQGMIADGNGRLPEQLQPDAYRRVLWAALDAAAAVAIGRGSHEAYPNAGDRRLVLTSQVASLLPDPRDAGVTYWNPAGAPFEAARLALGLRTGTLAVLGGPYVFDAFFGVGYDVFCLARANRVQLNGRPVFPGVGYEGTPEDVLKRRGYRAGPLRVLDLAAGVTATHWSAEDDALRS